MSKTIQTLSPKGLWQHFYQLTRIPRPSRHEGPVQAFVKDFGTWLGLKVVQDSVGNIILRKPATAGMAGRKPVILQGHLDMVPQANADTQHDFAVDPIDTRIDGDWVRANGTTLGADNGIGAAAIMAVMASGNLSHGPLEALFTCNEESGMDGAFGLKPDVLQGEILINTDADEEGVLCIGCAGGANVNTRFGYRPKKANEDWPLYQLRVTGLRGGHSGVDIHRGRGNAVELLFRLLRRLMQEQGVRLVRVDAGNLRNAIPREAFALLALPRERLEQVCATVAQMGATCGKELAQVEPQLKVELRPSAHDTEYWIEKRVQERLIHAVCACPSGVIRMSDSLPGLVETSTNLAVVRSGEDFIEVQNLVRSSVDTARDYLCDRIDSLFSLAGAKSDFDGQYPGWSPNEHSAVLSTVQQVYREIFGRPPETGAMHAGLECGIIGGTYPRLDMISFGPTIVDPHSPDERVQISSVSRFWDLLVATLARIPHRSTG